MVIHKRKLNKSLVWFSVLFCVGLVMLPLAVEAATLYLEPVKGEFHTNDTFLVEVRIDVEDECINAVEAHLSFSQDVLEVIDFSKGDSILTLWIEPPVIEQELGLISFRGGIPGGYCGMILPGGIRETSLLGRIALRAKHETEAKLKFLDNSQVLLNDGLGTRAKLVTKGAIFTILPEKLEIPKDEWQEKLKADNIPPELFEIKIEQDPAIFEGKYFIIFSTTDKQTGLAYFEVKEEDRDWRRAESPYLLEDQSLRSIIKVRAIDEAGNERVVKHLPLREPFPYWVIVLILIIGVVIWWSIRKKKIEARS